MTCAVSSAEFDTGDFRNEPFGILAADAARDAVARIARAKEIVFLIDLSPPIAVRMDRDSPPTVEP